METEEPAIDFQFVVDTREKTPWAMPTPVAKALKVGDYTAVGFENIFAIERKSYDDMYQCITTRLPHFKRQLAKLAKLKHAYLLIEASASAFLLGHIMHKLTGQQALERLIRLTNQYNIPFCFCDRKGGEIAQQLIYRWWSDEHR